MLEIDPPGLVPRLVGLRPHQHRATPLEYLGEAPFLLLTGGRGLGKTSVLGEVRDAYKGHTPVASIDCEDTRFTEPFEGQHTAARSPVSQALLVVAEQLAEPVPGAKGITFPRLASGLVAVAAGGWSDADSERIRHEAEQILLLNENGAWINVFRRKASRAAASVVAAVSSAGPLVQTAIDATLKAFSDSLVNRRDQRASTWWRDYPNAGDNARRGLMLLSKHFRAGGTFREHAERWLVRALLADLTDAYTGVLPRLQRLGRPIVVLDNVQSGPGPGFINAVLRDRSDGITDKVVFVGGLRGEGPPVLRGAVRRSLPDVAWRSGWTREPAAPSSWALLVSLPPLSRDDTLHVVSATCAETVPPHLPDAIYRLTGGNPLGVALLAESAAQHMPGATSPRELLVAGLQLHEHRDGRPTYLELLDRLVPAEHLDELTVLAAAHDHDSACALADALLPDGFGPADIRRLEALLIREGVSEAPGSFVGDTFVRTLLLLRLHRREMDHRQWREAHETLVRYYAPTDEEDGGGGDPARAHHRLHHELALGNGEPAVAYLRDSFPTLDTRAWLRSLRFIASAP
ncbi:hypothetical protein, partial [Streptomyces sp. NPDC003015]